MQKTIMFLWSRTHYNAFYKPSHLQCVLTLTIISIAFLLTIAWQSCSTVFSNGMEKRVGGQLSMVPFLTSEGFVSYLWSIFWNRKGVISLLLRTQKWFMKLWNFQFTDRISLIKMVSSFVRLRMCKVGSVI